MTAKHNCLSIKKSPIIVGLDPTIHFHYFVAPTNTIVMPEGHPASSSITLEGS